MNPITHETRREALGEVLEGLAGRQTAILSELTLCGDGGTTASELSKRMYDKGILLTPERNFVHPRLNELVTLDLVEITGKRACSITGRTCATYRVVPEERGTK